MITWHHTHPAARKAHRCEMCSRRIYPGETYLRGAGFDGTAWSWKECAHCEAARKLYDISDLDGEYNGDYFEEWALDVALSIPEARAKAGYRHGWRTQSGALGPRPTAVTP